MWGFTSRISLIFPIKRQSRSFQWGANPAVFSGVQIPLFPAGRSPVPRSLSPLLRGGQAGGAFLCSLPLVYPAFDAGELSLFLKALCEIR